MPDILGRRTECDAVEELLVAAQSGTSGSLVITGEAGIGKTMLMDHARETAQALGFRVERAAGAQSEMDFAFAGLHQLCTTLLHRADALPVPQQAALNVAFGLRDGAPPEKFLVGLATLNLLADIAEQAPLLCLIDDAQWLDEASSQILALVARRLGAERVALLFAARETGEHDARSMSGVPELHLRGLGEADARTLLATAIPTPLDDEVCDRIIDEARGNPLALLELPRTVQVARMAGGFDLPDVLRVPRRIEDSYQLRFASLPPDTQTLLLVAATDPTGDLALLWRAVAHMGIAREAVSAAEAAGLVELDAVVRFRHPLVRSAVYQAATPPDRRRAHEALAAATDSQSDPDRRAWHRAHAVQGPHEEVADELEQSAGRARARGGLAAAAAFLEQAATLTPEPARRAIRALHGSQAKYDAGAVDAAMELLALAEVGPLDSLQRGRLELLRAQLAFHTTRGSDVPGMLVDAARTLAPLDAARSREAYVQAIEAAFHAGRLVRGRGLLEVADAAHGAPPPPTPSRPVDLLLDGLTTRLTSGYDASVSELHLALETFREDGAPAGDGDRRWLWLACHAAAMLWDDEAIYALASRAVRLTREAGALTTLPAALNALSSMLVLMGELAQAGELLAEEAAITQAVGAPPLPNARLVLAAWRGDERETAELYASMVADATERGEGATVGLAQVSLAYLHNGLGNYDDALAAATPPCEYDELAHSSVALPELIEAAVRVGESERAADALNRLTSRAELSGTEWGLGLAARSRALTTAGPEAEAHYQEALERLGRCRMVAHLARAHLVYGEWLRRERRRRDAREQLRIAHELLSNMGADAFAERAARELQATGEHARKRTAQPTDALTPQELHIARLVATGATSREVGTQLFLSPRTIEAHLRSIFRKLDITSRRQLRDISLP